MKKKIILAIIILLFIIAGTTGYIYWSKLPKPIVEKTTKEDIELLLANFDISYSNTQKLPNNIQKYAKKYNVFNEIYNSDKPVFTYGYEEWSLKKNLSAKFHKDIQKRIKENNLEQKYNIIILSDPKKTIQQTARKNNLDSEKLTKSCKITNPNDENLFQLFETTSSCYYGTCIVNPKTNEYILLSKEYPELIIKVLQEYKQ